MFIFYYIKLFIFLINNEIVKKNKTILKYKNDEKIYS